MIRVVVADDDEVFREVLVDTLEADGRFEVVGIAVDAASAVETCREATPDLVLLDVRMPGGGPAAAAGVRALDSARTTRSVALSAQAGAGQVLGMLRSGASGFLGKGNVGADLPDLLVRVARGEVVVATPGADRFLGPLWGEDDPASQG